VAVATAFGREHVEARRQRVNVRSKRSRVNRRRVKEYERFAVTVIVVPGTKTV
jgi:hypothetical protein